MKTIPDIEQDMRLQEKTELTVKALDALIFRGPIKGMLTPLMTSMGMPVLSVQAILPQRKRRNLRRFLNCANEIMRLVLDDQVGLHEYTARLASQIETIQAIREDEKSK